MSRTYQDDSWSHEHSVLIGKHATPESYAMIIRIALSKKDLMIWLFENIIDTNPVEYPLFSNSLCVLRTSRGAPRPPYVRTFKQCRDGQSCSTKDDCERWDCRDVQTCMWQYVTQNIHFIGVGATIARQLGADTIAMANARLVATGQIAKISAKTAARVNSGLLNGMTKETTRK